MVKSQEIADINPWWKFEDRFPLFDQQLKREGTFKIVFKRKSLELKPNNLYIIRGPRQVGKTFWIKQKIRELIKKGSAPKSILYFSCDMSKTRKELSSAIKFYFDSFGVGMNPIYIFLDEISYINEWAYELKSLFDAGSFQNSCVVVTGSNPWDIKSKKERLPGRGIEGNEKMFYPLSFREFVIQSEIVKDIIRNSDYDMSESLKQFFDKRETFARINLEDRDGFIASVKNLLPFEKELQFFFTLYLHTGGFPESINSLLDSMSNSNNKQQKIDSNIYEKYINVLKGDLVREIKNETALRGLMDVIVRCQSSRTNFADITKEVGSSPDPKTIASYSDLLTENLLARIFYSYDFSKQNFKNRADKKIYFYDPFIYCAVKGWLSGKDGNELFNDILLNSELKSIIVESIIGNHLALIGERSPMKEMITFLWFYYDRSREIDFLYKKQDGEFTGIEVKYRNNVSLKDAARIDRIKEYYIISKDTADFRETVPIIPAPLFLFTLETSEGHL